MEVGTLVGTVYLAAGSFICLLGLVILRENPAQRLNRVASLMLLLGGIGAILGATDSLVRSLRPEGTFLFTDLARDFGYIWEFFFPALLLFAGTFPTPRPWLVRRRVLPYLLFVPHAFHFALLLARSMAGPGFGVPVLIKALPLLTHPLTLFRVALELLYRAHSALFTLVNLAYALAAMLLLWRSFRGARNPGLRQQIRLICLGLSFSLALYVMAVPLPLLLRVPLPDMWESSLIVVGLVAGSSSIAYAIVRHRFLDTQLLARRSVLYGLVVVAVVMAYLGVVKPMGEFVKRFTGSESALFETVFVVLTLLIFQPLVGRLEEGVDRLLQGDRGSHRRALEKLTRDVVTILDHQELARRLLEDLTVGFVVSRAVLLARVGGAGTFEVLARAGSAGSAREEENLKRVASCLEPWREGVLRPGDLVELVEKNEQGACAGVSPSELRVELLIPLRHGDELLGLLALGPKLTATRYTPDEVLLLETLANQTALALKNASLHGESLARAAFEEELAVARQIQQASLPAGIPSVGPFQLGGVNIPSRHVGGDYYDVVRLSNGRLLLAIADVSGKGVPAALLMSMIQASLRTQAEDLRPVREVVARLNRLVFASTASDRFATLFLALVDPVDMTVTFTNAGHDPPILVRADGETELCDRGGLVLGVVDEASYDEGKVRLAPGDRMVFYTDGVTEARDLEDREFGLQGLMDAVRQVPPEERPHETLDRLVSGVRRFTGDRDPLDDLTLLVLRVSSNGASASAVSARAAAEAGSAAADIPLPTAHPPSAMLRDA